MKFLCAVVVGLLVAGFIWLDSGQGDELVKSAIAANNARAGIVQPAAPKKPLEGWTVSDGCEELTEIFVSQGAKVTCDKAADIQIKRRWRRRGGFWIFGVTYINTTIICRGHQWTVDEVIPRMSRSWDCSEYHERLAEFEVSRQKIMAEILVIARTPRTH